jgi:hypothetical protein
MGFSWVGRKKIEACHSGDFETLFLHKRCLDRIVYLGNVGRVY